ncbi:cytochrome C oxidase copper chaperone-domain-containing protein [Catenaria anguillulae PL171]|uniref:Cytochrome C oxidase copper chaperone-domain-containing protein n=1 Tax=Catenaria anguillulae PL171 TaxID=765915 RepID=A0A1Y2HBB1_9FUNG|nr:cytochrome C oxidase copper chaperone-domain-containing protein [Catenaria anguillulae PL171]
MGNTSSTPAATAAATSPASYDHLFPKQYVGYNDAGKPVGPEGQVFKPCCVCPDTKRERDECVLREGDEEKCQEFIARHKACLRSYGFKPQ